MQPTETYSTPRRALDVEDYIDILRRHRGWIFGPFLLCVVVSVVGVYMWPDSYVSQEVVKITPQQIPESMVQSSINQAMFDRISSMEQEILSRNELTNIIRNYGLYPREISRMPVEDVIELMKKNISILPVTGANPNSGGVRTIPAFAIQFSYSDRLLAQKVVQDLGARFIDENIRNSTNRTFQTTQFMKDELDQAKKELDAIEDKLTAFRMKNNGKLPDQVQSNVQQVSALQSQVYALNANLSRAQQDKLQIEATLRILKDQQTEINKQPSDVMNAEVAQKNEKLAEADKEVQYWDDTLRVLRQKYSDNYPDVQTAAGRLAVAKQKRDEIEKEDISKKAESKSSPAPKVVNQQVLREQRDIDARIRQLQSSSEAKDLEIQETTKELKRATDAIKSYEARLETVPLGEQEYGDLVRDRDLAKQKYVDLEERLEKAERAEAMEQRKEGELLELLDPASLPMTPTEPKRPLVISVGAGIGLLLGIVIAGAREMKDTSLKNLKDVRAYTQLSILGSIPLLENDFVVRRRRRLAWLGWTTACLAAVVIMAGSVVYYYVANSR